MPLNPDDTRWASKTCSAELNPSEDLYQKWRHWDLTPNKLTMCFVKCVWKYSGLYDDSTNTIKIDSLKEQFKARGVPEPSDLRGLDGATTGTCEAVYMKSIFFLNNNKAAVIKAFWDNKAEAIEWYSKHKDLVKPYGTKASDFCKKYRGNCRIDCNYRYYRLVDIHHKVITERKLNFLDEIPQDKLKECKALAEKKSNCDVAATLKDCMQKWDKVKWKRLQKFLNIASATLDYKEAMASFQ
ncbi:hypothetical protein DMENIID0001_148260 [Sergentomyia squamirostris]